MRLGRLIWTLICIGLGLVGAFALGGPNGDYGGFGVYAVSVFFVVLLFIWLPGVLVPLALGFVVRAYRHLRT